MRRIQYGAVIGILMGFLGWVFGGCDIKPSEPVVPKYTPAPLQVEITGGPRVGKPVPYGSIVTFRWKASGGSGSYEYSYSLDGGAFSEWSSSTSVSYSDRALLTAGSHTFSVKVRNADTKEESEPVQQKFDINPMGEGDTLPPTVTFVSPPEGYKTVPGADLVLRWTLDDESNSMVVPAGIKAVYFARNDTSTWPAVWPEAVTSTTLKTPEVGTWTYYVKAIDRGGNATVAERVIEVSEPTILYIDEEVLEAGYSGDTPHLTPAEEFQHDSFYKNYVLDGFAYLEWDVAEKGYPTMEEIPSSITTIVWVGSGDYQNSSWGWNAGYDYTYSAYQVAKDTTGEATIRPTFLSEWLDAGKKLWIISENFLEEIDIGFGGYVFPNGFEDVYMHLAADSSYVGLGSDAGEAPLDIAPTSHVTEAEYPSLSVDIAKHNGAIGDGAGWDVDAMPYIDEDTEAVYQTPEGDVVGIRYPAGGTDTQFVFMSFPLYYFSPTAAARLGQHILGAEFGN